MSNSFLQSVAFAVLLAVLLFLPAGTLAWPQAWIFLLIFCGCSQATGIWLLKHDPALLAERKKSPFGAGQKPRDRAVIFAIMAGMAAWIIFMPLDARRFGWSHTPLWAQTIGAVLILGAFWGWIGVMRANSFASVQIELQKNRGQTVISTGPYAVVRHPMYAYTLLLLAGTPLLLGSLWGLVWLLLFIPLLAARIVGEEAMLMDGLDGYRAYTAKVRSRLLPGLW